MKILENWVNSGQNGLFGLDIGSSAVKLVSLRKTGGKFTAVCAAWADIDAAEGAGDQVPYARTLEAVRRCVQQVPATSARYAVCGLSAPDAAVRGFNFPPMPIEAIEQAVRFEAQQVCPMDIRHSVLDYQLMRTGDAGAVQKRSGILVAGTQQAIDQRSRLVKEAGASLALLDADGLAALNGLAAIEPLDGYQTVALIDLGMQFTNVIVVGPSGQPFVRDLTVGGTVVIEKIALITGRTVPMVHEALWPTAFQPTPPDVLTALHQAVRSLTQNISETLKYYATEEKIPFAEKVYLCGAGATVKPLVELLSDALPTEVAVFDPFKTIQIDPAAVGAELLSCRGPALVTATGLAMRTV